MDGDVGDEGAWEQLVEAGGEADMERIEGTIRFREVEGGVYVIHAGDTDYDPTNLPEDYRVDGLEVEADVVRQEEMASIRMVGPLVEIVRIRRTGAGVGAGSASGTASVAPGAFAVAGFLVPGMSAMSPDEAASWEGRTLYFSDTAAASGDHRCETPVHTRSRVSTDSLLRSPRLAPGSLDLPEPMIARVEVRCGGAPWPAPGGMLLEGRDGRWLLPWDGVWFELEAVPSA
jgi:hypothetical protein